MIRGGSPLARLAGAGGRVVDAWWAGWCSWLVGWCWWAGAGPWVARLAGGLVLVPGWLGWLVLAGAGWCWLGWLVLVLRGPCPMPQGSPASTKTKKRLNSALLPRIAHPHQPTVTLTLFATNKAMQN